MQTMKTVLPADFLPVTMQMSIYPTILILERTFEFHPFVSSCLTLSMIVTRCSGVVLMEEHLSRDIDFW